MRLRNVANSFSAADWGEEEVEGEDEGDAELALWSERRDSANGEECEGAGGAIEAVVSDVAVRAPAELGWESVSPPSTVPAVSSCMARAPAAVAGCGASPAAAPLLSVATVSCASLPWFSTLPLACAAAAFSTSASVHSKAASDSVADGWEVAAVTRGEEWSARSGRWLPTTTDAGRSSEEEGGCCTLRGAVVAAAALCMASCTDASASSRICFFRAADTSPPSLSSCCSAPPPPPPPPPAPSALTPPPASRVPSSLFLLRLTAVCWLDDREVGGVAEKGDAVDCCEC